MLQTALQNQNAVNTKPGNQSCKATSAVSKPEWNSSSFAVGWNFEFCSFHNCYCFNGAKLKNSFPFMCCSHIWVFFLHYEESFIHWIVRIVGNNNGCSSGISYSSSYALPQNLPSWSDNVYLSSCPLSKNSVAVHASPCFLQMLFLKKKQQKNNSSLRWGGGSFVSYGWLVGRRLCVTFNEVKVITVCVCY